MIILKLCCTACGKKFRSHSRHRINPAFNYVGALKELVVTADDIRKLKGIDEEYIQKWEEQYPYGVLVLNYIKDDTSSRIRTSCDICGGSLRAFAMWTGGDR